jgi:hypothetical protein
MEPPTICADAAAGAIRTSSKKAERTAPEIKVHMKEVKVVSCRLPAT